MDNKFAFLCYFTGDHIFCAVYVLGVYLQNYVLIFKLFSLLVENVIILSIYLL